MSNCFLNLLFVLISLLSTVSCVDPPKQLFCGNGSPRSPLSEHFGRGICSERYYQCPQCINTDSGYKCRCGIGFSYRPKNSMCVATSIDSSLEFKRPKTQQDYPSYTLLIGTVIPTLTQFTISFRIQVTNSSLPGTVLSYTPPNRALPAIEIISGPTFRLRLLETFYDTKIVFTPFRWYHIVWTWSHSTPPNTPPCPTCGQWRLYIDSQIVQTSHTIRGATRHNGIGGVKIPGSGRLIIGQTTPDENGQFRTEQSFDGALAYVNLWNEQLSADDVKDLFNDCQSYRCGNLVQWTQFRAGTRGSARIRWPIKIFDSQCFEEESSGAACEEFCQIVHGRYCPSFIDSNVYWPRTVEGNYAVVPCPGSNYQKGAVLSVNSTGVAYRMCARNPTQPFWDKEIAFQKCRMPYFEQILTELRRALYRQTQQFQQTLGTDMTQTGLAFLYRFLNYSENTMGTITSPVDIASMVELLRLICRLQEYAVKRVITNRRPLAYPTFEDTVEFGEKFAQAVELLAGPQCESAWKLVQPLGSEANNLYRLLDQFSQLIVDSFQSHIVNREASLSQTVLRVVRSSIVIKIQVVRWTAFRGFAMPDTVDAQEFGVDSNDGTLLLPRESVDSLNLTMGDQYLGISSLRFDTVGKYLPNHNVVIQSKWNNINSAVMTFKLHGPSIEPYANFTTPFTVKLKYSDNFNISSPNCVRLLHKETSARGRDYGNEWSWTRSGCVLKEFTTTTATCVCNNQGHFALTTNMFDPDWNREQEPPPLLNIASYFGLSFGFLCVTASVIVLNYYGTYTTTASIHKHFGFALAMAKLCLMVGIEMWRYNLLTCRIFTVLNHFFFTAAFCWLLNEGVNMYIMVTYSAHSKSQQAEQEGPQWKYYIIGWGIPTVIVGALCGAQGDVYYSPNMCWVSWATMWSFLGPVIGVLSVNVLILTFALKEHHETAYTKNEKANKIIGTHMKAIWTQLILLSSDWLFAFMSLRMLGHVIKILFMIVTTLQGSFFLIFYVLLNDEVRRLRADRLREMEQREDETRRSLEDLLAAAVIGKDSMVVKRGGANESVRIAIKQNRNKSDDEEESTITELRGNRNLDTDSD